MPSSEAHAIAKEFYKFPVPGERPLDLADLVDKHIAALREDKARLDWLDDRIVSVSDAGPNGAKPLFRFVPAGYGAKDDGSIRESIDARKKDRR